MVKRFKEGDKVVYAKYEDYGYVFGVVDEIWGNGTLIVFKVTEYGTLHATDRPKWKIGSTHELPVVNIYHSIEELKAEFLAKQFPKAKEKPNE